ncbi:MAG: hypothetical protein H6Q05_3505 [Acidobacteria bacterium]|nr:hypothetical protein [Acidobacteriota bacterium]
MKSLSGSKCKTLFMVLLFSYAVWVLSVANALAQDAPQYTPEEYNASQAIAAEADAAKKAEMIVNFVKTYPKSTLKEYITSDFQAALKKLEDERKWQQVIAAGRLFLSAIPGDPYTVALVAEGYSQTKNYSQFVVYGEQIYKSNPSGNLAYGLAKAYQTMNNQAKFLEWAQKTVAALPDNYEMLLGLAVGYGDLNRTAESEKYARQCLKVIQAEAKPETTSEEDWTKYKNHTLMACYYIIGNAAFTKQDFTGAIKNLESSLQYNPRNDRAYYFLGESYWQMRNTNQALKNYAKAYLLGGAVATPAKLKMENLYKSTHKNSLVGLDKVIAVAKSELK